MSTAIAWRRPNTAAPQPCDGRSGTAKRFYGRSSVTYVMLAGLTSTFAYRSVVRGRFCVGTLFMASTGAVVNGDSEEKTQRCHDINDRPVASALATSRGGEKRILIDRRACAHLLTWLHGARRRGTRSREEFYRRYLSFVSGDPCARWLRSDRCECCAASARVLSRSNCYTL